jgi:hypothetical protein
MKKIFTNKMANTVEPASTVSKDWGYIPVPSKGGKTGNATIINKKEND